MFKYMAERYEGPFDEFDNVRIISPNDIVSRIKIKCENAIQRGQLNRLISKYKDFKYITILHVADEIVNSTYKKFYTYEIMMANFNKLGYNFTIKDICGVLIEFMANTLEIYVGNTIRHKLPIIKSQYILVEPTIDFYNTTCTFMDELTPYFDAVKNLIVTIINTFNLLNAKKFITGGKLRLETRTDYRNNPPIDIIFNSISPQDGEYVIRDNKFVKSNNGYIMTILDESPDNYLILVPVFYIKLNELTNAGYDWLYFHSSTIKLLVELKFIDKIPVNREYNDWLSKNHKKENGKHVINLEHTINKFRELFKVQVYYKTDYNEFNITYMASISIAERINIMAKLKSFQLHDMLNINWSQTFNTINNYVMNEISEYSGELYIDDKMNLNIEMIRKGLFFESFTKSTSLINFHTHPYSRYMGYKLEFPSLEDIFISLHDILPDSTFYEYSFIFAYEGCYIMKPVKTSIDNIITNKIQSHYTYTLNNIEQNCKTFKEAIDYFCQNMSRYIPMIFYPSPTADLTRKIISNIHISNFVDESHSYYIYDHDYSTYTINYLKKLNWADIAKIHDISYDITSNICYFLYIMNNKLEIFGDAIEIENNLSEIDNEFLAFPIICIYYFDKIPPFIERENIDIMQDFDNKIFVQLDNNNAKIVKYSQFLFEQSEVFSIHG